MKDEINLKKEYQELKKKYPELPLFEDLDKEFEISYINLVENNKHFFLRLIRRRMHEKIVFFCRIIEELVYPSNGAPYNVQEPNSIPKEKKEALIKLYKKIMDVERCHLQLNLETNNKKEVEYINYASKKVKQFKPILIETANLMRKAWTEEKEEQGEQYFG